MSDEFKARPAPTEPGRSLKTARFRSNQIIPSIGVGRHAILRELDRKASESERYRDWPEQVPGVPIGFMPGCAGPMCYDLDTHRLVLGKTGGGKATAGISYMLLHDDGHAVVVLDPKSGSVARVTAGYRQTLGPVHIVDPYNMTGFFDKARCARLNPLDALDPHGPTLVEDAAGLASALCYLPDGGGNDHTFWDRSARMFTNALILHLVTAPGENADLLRLWEILTYPGSRFLAEIVKPMQDSPACGGTVARYGDALAQHALGNMRSFSDVLATIRSYLSWIEFQQVRAVTDQSTFDFSEVRERGGTVYIVMDDDRLDVCASWARLMLQSARLGLKRSQSKRPVHFIIDEAAALGKLDLITTGLRAWREAKIRLHLFYQDIGQIKSAFRDGWSSVSNTDVVQFMGCNPLDVETAEQVSKMLGERDMIVPTFGEGTSTTTGSNESQALSRSSTETSGTSTNVSDSVNRTDGSNWSTTTGTSHTIGTGYSTTTGSTSGMSGNTHNSGTSSSTTYSRNESFTNSRSDTFGGSTSKSVGHSAGRGTSNSLATGRSETATRGTSQGEGTSTNRSFTLQLRRRMRPEELRMLPDDQMIVVAGNREAALVHKEHYYRNPRLVARAVTRYAPDQIGPIAPEDIGSDALPLPARDTPKTSLLAGLLSIFLPSNRR